MHSSSSSCSSTAAELWSAQQARCATMAEAGDTAAVDHSELIANFSSITDAAPHVAEAFLESCNFELERAVDLYFSGNEPNPPAARPRAAPPPQPGACALVVLLGQPVQPPAQPCVLCPACCFCTCCS